MDAAHGNPKDSKLLTKREADYLGEGKGGGVAVSAAKASSLDSSIEFGSAPQSAQLGKAAPQAV